MVFSQNCVRQEGRHPEGETRRRSADWGPRVGKSGGYLGRINGLPEGKVTMTGGGQIHEALSSEGYVIRLANEADLEAVALLVQEAYRPYIGRIGNAPGPMSDDYLQHCRDSVLWLLANSNKIAGLLVLLPREDHLLLDNIAVASHWRGLGAGRRLAAFAEAEAHRLGLQEIRLYTHQAMTENIALYKRLGYRETGRGEQGGFQRVFFRKTLSIQIAENIFFRYLQRHLSLQSDASCA